MIYFITTFIMKYIISYNNISQIVFIIMIMSSLCHVDKVEIQLLKRKTFRSSLSDFK